MELRTAGMIGAIIVIAFLLTLLFFKFMFAIF